MSFREGSGGLIIYLKPNLKVTFKAANHKNLGVLQKLPFITSMANHICF